MKIDLENWCLNCSELLCYYQGAELYRVREWDDASRCPQCDYVSEFRQGDLNAYCTRRVAGLGVFAPVRPQKQAIDIRPHDAEALEAMNDNYLVHYASRWLYDDSVVERLTRAKAARVSYELTLRERRRRRRQRRTLWTPGRRAA